MSKHIQPIGGMHDVLPDTVHKWQHVETTVRRVLDAYAYREIRLPIMEYTELFCRSIGETTDIVEKEMYTFEDRDGDSLTLRPEATAGMVRAGISNGLLHNQRQRLWCQGPMFRHEKPQRGRYRQFHQINVEALGFEGPDIDVELVLLSARLWRELGVTDLTLEINSLGTPESRRDYRQALVEYFESHEDRLDEDSLRRLGTNPMRILDSKSPELQEIVGNAPAITDFLDPESARHFETLCDDLAASGIPYKVNPRLVRGLDYYTRTVFEWVTDRLGSQNAVCSGGRYDGLVEQLGGRATPAIGWALGVERLVAVMDEVGVVVARGRPDVYVVAVGDGTASAALSLAESLRDGVPGIKVQCHFGGGGFKAQMKQADKSGAAYALILGEAELTSREAGLKPLRKDGAQQQMRWDDLSTQLGGLLTPGHS